MADDRPGPGSAHCRYAYLYPSTFPRSTSLPTRVLIDPEADDFYVRFNALVQALEWGDVTLFRAELFVHRQWKLFRQLTPAELEWLLQRGQATVRVRRSAEGPDLSGWAEAS
jgi:hypothetical protein